MFDIQLFGRIEVRTRGVRLSRGDFGGVRPRHLLALLALRGEASISELADTLGIGRRKVEDDLGILRRHLEPDAQPGQSVIVTQRGRLRLDPERVRVDVARFDELINMAARRPVDRARKPLAAAAFLAARPLLEGEDAPWAAEARNEYRAKLAMAQPGAIPAVLTRRSA